MISRRCYICVIWRGCGRQAMRIAKHCSERGYETFAQMHWSGSEQRSSNTRHSKRVRSVTEQLDFVSAHSWIACIDAPASVGCTPNRLSRYQRPATREPRTWVRAWRTIHKAQGKARVSANATQHQRQQQHKCYPAQEKHSQERFAKKLEASLTEKK